MGLTLPEVFKIYEQCGPDCEDCPLNGLDFEGDVSICSYLYAITGRLAGTKEVHMGNIQVCFVNDYSGAARKYTIIDKAESGMFVVTDSSGTISLISPADITRVTFEEEPPKEKASYLYDICPNCGADIKAYREMLHSECCEKGE